jgi:hypothetical protein
MKYRKFTKKELEWVKEFEKVMKKAPKTLFMFVAGGVLIGTKDENNERYIRPSGSMDNGGNWINITTKMEVDGGDW